MTVVNLKGAPYCPNQMDTLFDAELGVCMVPARVSRLKLWLEIAGWLATMLAGMVGVLVAVGFTVFAVSVAASSLVDLVGGWL